MKNIRNLAAAIGRLRAALDEVAPDSRHATKLKLAMSLVEEVERLERVALKDARSLLPKAEAVRSVSVAID